jgi:hypothetical protein
MSNALALAAITATLRELLEGMLPDSSSIGGRVKVTAQAPDLINTDAMTSPQLNLFLYQVTPNAGWGNVGLPARDARGERTANPPLALDLHYLLTAYAKEDFQAEIVLGYAMQCLHEWPVLPREKLREMHARWKRDGDNLRRALSTSNLAEQVEAIKVSPAKMDSEELSKLWTAFQSSYHLTAAYLVSVALIESALPARSALPVLKRGEGDRGWDSFQGSIPQIEHVLPQFVEPGAEITLKGRNLVADRFTVMFGHSQVTFDPSKPPTVTPAGDLQVQIPDDLPAGIIPVSVRTSRGLTSNTAALVLRPKIVEAKQELRKGKHRKDVKVLTVQLEPEVQPGQRGLLLLNERKDDLHDPQPRRAYSIGLPRQEGATGIITVEVPQVQPGTYLVRVQIDGAESQLIPPDSDAEPYAGPLVTIR